MDHLVHTHYYSLGSKQALFDAVVTEGGAALVAALEVWLERALAAGRAGHAVRDDLPISLQRQLTFAVLRAMDDWSLRHLQDLDPSQRRRLAGAEFDSIRRLLAP